MSQRITLSSGAVTAGVKLLGAELCSLADAAGQEHMWQAGPAWPRHAPILFPIVGRVHGDALTFGEDRYPIGQHGFARDLPFTLLDHRAESCRLLLTDSAETWPAFPFPFRLEVSYALRGTTLSIGWALTNPGETVLPCSIGAHPAFRWPLPGAGTKPAHRLEFEQDEPGPIFRPGAEGLIDPTPCDFPLNGRTLGLREELFAAGAMILMQPASRRVRFTAPGTRGIELAWQGFTQLGLWMKPGADFLCIEPWEGHADILGQRTDGWSRPGMMMLAPAETRHFQQRISLGA